MSRYAPFIVSLATLFAVGCAPASSFYNAVNPWSSNFDTAVDRCSAIGEPAGTTGRTGCERRMNRFLADEKKYKKSFCYTAIDRVVCKKDPLYPFDAKSALNTSEADYTSGR